MNICVEEVDNLERIMALNEALGFSEADKYWKHAQKNIDKGALIPIIVSCEGVDAGYGYLNLKPKYKPYERFNIYETQDLNVLPEFRQRGLATAMIEYCEDKARQAGCSEIGISVGLSASYGPAQRLYCKLGYLPDGQGITYDRQTLSHGDQIILNDDLCLMMMKSL
jgi:GNAT superfamily N-acetyltransferase